MYNEKYNKRKKNISISAQLYSTTCKRQPHVSSIYSSHYQAVKIEENEIGGACSAYGREERRIQGFGGET